MDEAAAVIQIDGTVSHVRVAGTDLPDPRVVGCVLEVFPRLRFMAPEGGIVSVVYPVMLAPG